VFFTVRVFRPMTHEHEVVVGPAGTDSISMLGDAGGQGFRVHHYLPLILAKLRLERFMKANGLCSDHVHQRSALHPWEKRRIDLIRKFFFAHDNAAPRSSLTLVSGRDL